MASAPMAIRGLCAGLRDLRIGHHRRPIGARSAAEGEIVKLDEHGVTSVMGHARMPAALCSFEYVYFARPDSVMEGQVIHEVRQQLGRQLAREAPVDADIVIAVPDSATPHAIGYSLESGIPLAKA